MYITTQTQNKALSVILHTNIESLLVWVGLKVVPVLPVVGLHSLVWLIKEGEIDNSLDPLWQRHIHIRCAHNTIELTCMWVA